MHPLSTTAIERTPPRLRRPVELTVRTVDAAIADRLPGLAAELAFWVLLSLPSLLLTAVAVASVIGGLEGQDWQGQLIDQFLTVSRVALTEETVQEVVRPLLERLFRGGGLGVVSFGFLATVWTASRAVRVVLVTAGMVYGREQDRRGWQHRLLGFAITLGGLLVGILLAPLLIAGPGFGDWLADTLRIGVDLRLLGPVWRIAYWPTVMIGATVSIAALYHLGVPGRTRWLDDLPGAALATAVWLAGSGGLRLYGQYATGSESVYGPLAGPIVGLLWLWLTGFAVLLGAELNAQRHAPRS
jgi:membrane protein